MSNFPCTPHQKASCITQYEEDVAFYSLLRWKMIILSILTTSLIHLSSKGWENVLFELGVKGLTIVAYRAFRILVGEPPLRYLFFSRELPFRQPTGASVKVDKSDHIILEDLVPDLGPYYTYNGTLSVPPCHGPVQWIVLHKKIRVSPKQVNMTIGMTAREGLRGLHPSPTPPTSGSQSP